MHPCSVNPHPTTYTSENSICFKLGHTLSCVEQQVHEQMHSDGIHVVLGRARDETLAGLGVRLEDRPDGTSTWKARPSAPLIDFASAALIMPCQMSTAIAEQDASHSIDYVCSAQADLVQDRCGDSCIRACHSVAWSRCRRRIQQCWRQSGQRPRRRPPLRRPASWRSS